MSAIGECAYDTVMHETCSNMKTSSQIKFVLDSGATEHMVNNENYFDSLSTIEDISISSAKQGAGMCAKQHGDISVKTFYNGDCGTKVIKDVLFVKDLK